MNPLEKYPLHDDYYSNVPNYSRTEREAWHGYVEFLKTSHHLRVTMLEADNEVLRDTLKLLINSINNSSQSDEELLKIIKTISI